MKQEIHGADDCMTVCMPPRPYIAHLDVTMMVSVTCTTELTCTDSMTTAQTAEESRGKWLTAPLQGAAFPARVVGCPSALGTPQNLTTSGHTCHLPPSSKTTASLAREEVISHDDTPELWGVTLPQPCPGFLGLFLAVPTNLLTRLKLRLFLPFGKVTAPLEISFEVEGKRACFRQKQQERASLLLKQTSGGLRRI